MLDCLVYSKLIDSEACGITGSNMITLFSFTSSLEYYWEIYECIRNNYVVKHENKDFSTTIYEYDRMAIDKLEKLCTDNNFDESMLNFIHELQATPYEKFYFVFCG